MDKLPDGKESAVSCPDCGPATLLVVRTNSKTKNQFLGCSNYPDCRYTQPLPESVKMRLMEYKTLF